LGFASGETILYAAAGLALAHVNSTWAGVDLPSAVSDLTPAAYRTNAAGGVFAAGIEHAFGRFTLAAEYDYYDLHGSSGGGAYSAEFQEQLNIRDEMHLAIQAATLRLSYRFGAP
jgi:hypothetical protein